MQDTWLRNKADVIQSYADRHDLKNFYDALKEVYGPTSSGSSPLLSADGNTLFTDKEKIIVRWAEHFNSVLNRPSPINNEAINRLTKCPSIKRWMTHQLCLRPRKRSFCSPVARLLVQTPFQPRSTRKVAQL